MAYERVRLSANDKISLIGNLSTMLSAGIPILEAVTSILEDTKGSQKKILETLRDDLMQGKRVHSSLSAFPRVFDKVTVNLIKASEEAGTLETTLKDLKDHMQKEMEFVDKIKFAMIYPVLILVVFAGVLLMILIVVVPKIASVFSRLNVDLPLPTRMLIGLSDLIVKYNIYLLVGLALFFALVSFLYQRNRSLVLNAIFSLPLLSTLSKQVDFARFTRSLHLLLSSGLPITSALELSKDVVSRRSIAQVIINARDMVLSGKRLTDGFRAAKGVMPSIMVKLTEAGEKSGTLDKSMAEISAYLDYQVSNTLKTLTAVMEPIMLLAVGIAVGGMMLAIIAPIYGLIGSVGSR